MFFFLAMFVVGFLLTAFLSPKMKVENAKASQLSEFKFPRSKEGDPVARFYGTIKNTSPNTISISNFKAVPIKKKVKTGLFSSKKVITGYKYYLTVDLAWALGPGVVYRRMWSGKNLIWGGCLYEGDCVTVVPINLPELYGGSEDGKRGGLAGTVRLYCGDFDQPRNAVLTAQVDADVPAYIGTAHAVFEDFWWGNNPTIDALAMEMAFFDNSIGLTYDKHIMPNGLDHNPVAALYHIICEDWGNLGYDPAKINVAQWREVAKIVRDEGNGFSIIINSGTDSREIVKTLLRQINGLIVEDQSTGLIDLKLLRADYDVAEIPTLGPADIAEVRNYTKKLWTETFNVVRVKYTDRDDNYASDKIAPAKDSSLLRFQGRERPMEITMPGVYNAELASELAHRELSNLNVPLYSCELVLKRTAIGLTPGSVFVFTWPEYGIVSMVMRVRKMGLGTLEDGKITLQVVQDEFSIDAAVVAPPAPSGYVATDLLPVDLDTFYLVELPAWLDARAALGTRVGFSRYAALVAPPSAYTMGFSAYVDDTDEDVNVVNVGPYAATGKLTSKMTRFLGFDSAGVLLTLEIDNVQGTLDDAVSPRDGGGMFFIDSELFAYTSATDHGGGLWTLNDVHRALLDTGWAAHAIGATLWFMSSPDVIFDADSEVGVPITAYLIDKTPTGSSQEADAIKTPLTPVGRVERVIAPDWVTGDGSHDKWETYATGDTITVDARPRSRLEVDGDVWYENDAAGTAEPGTTYRLQIESMAGVLTTVADDVALPYDLVTDAGMEGAVILHVSAKRDGLYSIATSPLPVMIGGDFLFIDDDPVTIDGQGVTF